MPLIRLVGSWISAILLGLIVVGPLAALCACALLDRGADGTIRSSIFPVAITALDPFIWTCIRNSAAAAGAIAGASMLVGVCFGRMLGDWRFPSRTLVIAMLTAAAAMPPVIIALGVSMSFGVAGPKIWHDWTVRLGTQVRFLPLDWGWLVWFWSAVAQGGAITTLAYLSAHQRLDPAWRDAARLAGGARTRVWRKLSWPLLRPVTARAGGLVFALTLADLGAPLILGLRRTLGYQIVSAGLGSEPFPRIAVLGLIVLLLCLIVQLILLAWAGTDLLGGEARARRPVKPQTSPTASWRRTFAVLLFTGLWSILIAAPTAAIVAGACQTEAGRGVASWALRNHHPSELLRRLLDPTVVDILVRSVLLGVAVALLSSVSRRIVHGLQAAAGDASAERFQVLVRVVATPPVLGGIVVLAVGALARMGSESVVGAPALWEPYIGLGRLAGYLDVDQSPLLVLTLGVWLAMAPLWIGGHDRPHVSATIRTPRVAAAVLAGARRRRAQRLAGAPTWPARWRSTLLVSILAATNITPAVLLASSAHDSVIGPSMLLFHESPEEGLATASALAATILTLSVTAGFLCRSNGLGRVSRLRAR